MCGRFTLRTPAHEIAEAFGVLIARQLALRYNIAPTQEVVAIRADDNSDARQLTSFRWGLIPSWADDPAIGNRMINARGETLAEKAAFKKAFASRRCLIPADGFYEWMKQGKAKQPYSITLADGGLFAFAGLWERWRRGEEAIESCTIITTNANALVEPLHERMLVILPPESYDLWLDPAVGEFERLTPLLAPYPAEQTRMMPVNPIVNSPKNDTPECVLPVELKRQQGLDFGDT